MKQVVLPTGESVPALGQGTWMMGEDPARRKDELAALRHGIERGMTLIDTAEMYGDGASEGLVGEAIAGRRDGIFLVSKAYPQNASRQRLPLACEQSLERLGTDRIDLYLLHWRGGVPLAETVEAMEALRAAGKIRHWGVSNLDLADMQELIDAGGENCATDQILYNLTRRGPEFDLLPWLEERKMPVMAYSPVEQGRLLRHKELAALAAERGATAAKVALAFVLRREGMIAIPKAGNAAHVTENAEALGLNLGSEDWAELDRIFPPPTRPLPLDML
jgi:diketogulonate reductase-like aldo/keto reductase